MQKIYCYVDETGQDTKGKLFLVAVVVTDKERDQLSSFLLEVEKTSGKYFLKWRKTSFKARIDYLSKTLVCPLVHHSIFFSKYEGVAYVDLTVLTTAKAVLQRSQDNYKATIFVDGLRGKAIRQFGAGLRKLKIRVRKVRGVKDESDPLIRLADAMAGFLRDHTEEQGYAQQLFKEATDRKVIKEI